MEQIHLTSTLELTPAQRATLQALSPRLAIRCGACHSPGEVSEALDDRTELLYTFHVPGSLKRAPRLRWVQFHTAGADHAMDTPLWQSPITITTASGIHATPIGEYVLASMLAFTHRLRQRLASQKEALWPKDRFERLGGRELRGRTVCVVGYGSLGREAARLCRCAGMRVLAVKRDPAARRDPGFVLPETGDPEGLIPEAFFGPERLLEALGLSDFVILSLPATASTRRIIGERELRAMPRHAYLVNVSRGSVVDQEALIRALKEGWIGGAGLDVFEPEPLPGDSPLWGLDNVILTPHISGFSLHIGDYAVQVLAENLRRHLAGEPLLNVVDRAKGY
jgi:phosphoglycerate dehydrogenase-like enzyme